MKNTTLAVRPSQSLAVDPDDASMTVQQVLGQVALIQQIMGAAMREGEHWGRIPGCGDKPTLLKPGAEKLCLTFRLAPTYEIDERNLDNGHREYRIVCTLTSILNGKHIGQGVGTCSTMEAKYRFRKGEGEPTENPVPRAYWDLRGENPAKAQELIGGKGFTVNKVDGKGWMIAKGGEKTENDNPADCFNTVLKISKKRALVDAVLTATAASDLFTQDLEDIQANLAAVGGQQPTQEWEVVPGATSSPVDSGANASRGSQPKPPAAPSPSPVSSGTMTDDEAWAVEVHFGTNKGRTLKSLTDGQRRYYFDKWPTTTKGTSPADKRLLQAIKTLAPFPHDKTGEPQERPTDEPAVDFRETRIHFGKNRGLMLSELTPQQVHWYEADWMPKKEVNGPTSVEDLALISGLKAYRKWRGQPQPSPGQSKPKGGQAAPAPIQAEEKKPWVDPTDEDDDVPF